jgi:cytochrome c554/c'-like protein
MAWEAVAVNRIRRMAATAALVFAAVFACALRAADAPPLGEADQACLACHGQEGLTKTFGKGESVALHVKGEAFARSVHAALGCSGCHSDVDLKSHPGVGKPFATAREFSLAQAGACRQCHEDAFEQHKGSVHAAAIARGNTLAPTCTGCHGFHTVTPKTAYETCVNCHSVALVSHRYWLPNAALHHEVVSCAACHAPNALRMVDLRFYDVANKRWVVEPEGAQAFEKLAKSLDADKNGLDPVELASLLKQVNGDPAAPKTLRGRIELRNNVEAHRLSDKSMAIRACDGCHRVGAEPFQNVTVSMTGADGRPVRHAAQRQVLDSPIAMRSLPEFYAIGGTRSAILDWLLLAALAAGIGFPVGHLTLRWIFRKLRQGK